MSPLAFGLLLLSAVLHAAWNVLIARAADRQATLWWALLGAAVLLSPTLVAAWPPAPEALLVALGSSAFEVVYFLALIAAYAAGDFSLVYPVARGSAPLLIALWAALFLGERPSTAGWAGIGLVVGGLLLASAPGRSAPSPGQASRPLRALVLALTTGTAISGYSTLNKVGVSYLAAPAFTCLFHLGTALMLAPILARSRGRKLLEPWSPAERGRTLAVAVLVAVSSTLVLTALAIERAGYVGAVREVSVIFGALAGWLLLREPLGPRRTIAAAVMFGGLTLIALRG